MEREPTYHLEGVIHSREEMEDFEGPLNLILLLLSKDKIEIRDISVTDILEQYLNYLEQMKSMNLEIASEFVQMAAHLLYLKTRMLLTAGAEEEHPGELEVLIASLEELKFRGIYRAVKELAPALGSAAALGSLYHTKTPEPLPTVKEYRYQHERWELLKALANVFYRQRMVAEAPESPEEHSKRIYPKRIVYSVREKSREILLRLAGEGALPLQSLYASCHSRSETVATFLSVLELCSLGHTVTKREGEEIYVAFTGMSLENSLESISE